MLFSSSFIFELSKYNSYSWIIWVYSVDLTTVNIKVDGTECSSMQISHLDWDVFIFDLYWQDFKKIKKVVWIEKLSEVLAWEHDFLKNIMMDLEKITII